MRIDQQFLARFRADTEGAVAVIVALTFVMLMGFVALGVDTASLYRERHKLQSITDLAALSAVPELANAESRVTASKSANGVPEAATELLTKGRYLRNPAIPPDARFSPLPDGTPGMNAVRVRLRDDAPLSFAQIFTEDDHVTLRGTALAARTGAVSYSLDSAIAQLDGAAMLDFLNSAFTTSVSVNATDLAILAGTSVSAGDLVQALASQIGFNGANPADILNATVTPEQVLSALQSISTTSLANVVSLLSATEGSTLTVSEIVGGIDTELGLTVIDFLDEVQISALDVLMAVVPSTAPDQSIALDLNSEVSGLLSLNVSLIEGERAAQSGWIAMGEEGVTLHRAAVRVDIDTELSPTLLGSLLSGVTATRLHLPLYLEVAGATATLDRMSCSENPAEIAAEFVTSSTPLHPTNGTSVAALYLGELAQSDGATIDPSTLGFADFLTLEIRIPVPLLPDITVGPITVQVRSLATIGQSNTERLRFTRGDMNEGRTTQSFGSESLLTSGVTSLLSSNTTEVRIKPGQGNLLSSLTAGLLNTVMEALPLQLAQTLTGPVDTLLDSTLASIGLELGAGRLTVDALHCERAQLVQ